MVEEIQNENLKEPTKKKGFLSNIFKRSSSNNDNSEDGKAPKNKSFMNSLMDNAGQAATKEVEHLAEHEAMKEVESAMNNNNTNDTSQTTTPDPQTAATDAVNGATSWAKRMVNSAQQKMQSLQNIDS